MFSTSYGSGVELRRRDMQIVEIVIKDSYNDIHG